MYDKEREDSSFVPQAPFKRTAVHPPSQSGSSNSSTPSEIAVSGEGWDPLESIFVTVPRWQPANAARGKADREKTAKNPMGHWKVSKRGVVGMFYAISSHLILL